MITIAGVLKYILKYILKLSVMTNNTSPKNSDSDSVFSMIAKD